MCKFRPKDVVRYRLLLRIFTILPILLFCTTHAGAVDAIAGHNNFFLPAPDFGMPATGYTEVYWQIAARSLHYHKADSGMVTATIRTDIIVSSNGKTVTEEHYLLQTKPLPTAAAAVQHIFEIKKFYLLAGKYKISVILSETGFEQKNFVYTDSINLEPPATGQPFFSNLQNIDTSIASTDKKNIIYQNGNLLLPYTTNFIDDYRKRLTIYTELYNLKAVEKEQYPLTERLFISKGNDGVPLGNAFAIDTIQQAGKHFSLNHFDLSPFSSGNYYVNARLADKQNNVLAEKNYFFQLVNKNPVKHLATETDKTTTHNAAKTGPAESVTYMDVGKTFVAKYNYQEVKAILEMLIPASDPTEATGITQLLKRPDENYMRYLIYNHFERINKKDPEKAWTEYTEKVKEVNRLFGKGSKPGYSTDRGKIYLKYGKPDDRTIVNNERGSYPYEIWQYFAVAPTNREGLFLFYLPTTAMEHILLYSTVIGEPHNTDWRNFLYLGNNPTSRAEQYLNNKQ